MMCDWIDVGGMSIAVSFQIHCLQCNIIVIESTCKQLEYCENDLYNPYSTLSA